MATTPTSANPPTVEIAAGSDKLKVANAVRTTVKAATSGSVGVGSGELIAKAAAKVPSTTADIKVQNSPTTTVSSSTKVSTAKVKKESAQPASVLDQSGSDLTAKTKVNIEKATATAKVRANKIHLPYSFIFFRIIPTHAAIYECSDKRLSLFLEIG